MISFDARSMTFLIVSPLHEKFRERKTSVSRKTLRVFSFFTIKLFPDTIVCKRRIPEWVVGGVAAPTNLIGSLGTKACSEMAAASHASTRAAHIRHDSAF